MKIENTIEYRGEKGICLDVKCDGETMWLTQEQMCLLFGRERSVITKHINNVFKECELPKEGFVQILHKTSEVGGVRLPFTTLMSSFPSHKLMGFGAQEKGE